MPYDVIIETHFCAAHALREYKGATEPTHGHNFQVVVTVTGDKVDAAGMAVDFLDLKPLVDEEVGRLHYRDLNADVPEFAEKRLSPSAENIARVLYERLAARLPSGVRMASVRVGESPGCWAQYRA
ncbi:MAG: 6-carboxytetrahydropterin synthase [Planctomycetes bacterium]|nr:6-carboxytetrahydropterin synthase [Planctomycetota bacterium]